MKLLLIHNYYQQRGGEDGVFEGESRLLEQHGHSVLHYTAHNRVVETTSPMALARDTVWNHAVNREVAALIARERPSLMHVHNTLPRISPSIYYAAKAGGIPVVQTLHNYRLYCPSASLFRDGSVCEECLHTKVPVPAIRHACYRGSRAASAAIAAMLTIHRALGTWAHVVDLFIALSEFAREKLVSAGLPGEKVMVKPNFACDPGVRANGGDYGLFVGRLSREKGVDVLLKAWGALNAPIPLKIIGDGNCAPQVAQLVQTLPTVEWLGQCTATQVTAAMAGARFLVFPSVWYEGFPLTIAEAFAVGLPVIASELGSMSQLIHPHATGLHVRPGDPTDLAEKVEWAWAHPDQMRAMGENARREYEERYTPEQNYKLLMEAYGRVLPGRDSGMMTPAAASVLA